MITILADKHIFHLDKFIPEDSKLELYDPADGFPGDVSEVDALLVRTVTKINKKTLENFSDRLRFIGTASSGTDHVDIPFLQSKNIHFADAAGCNARAVAEYIATSLLLWSEKYHEDLQKLTVGIIGVGHVGNRVHELLYDLGISTVLYDPPRENRDSSFKSSSLNAVLKADILTFHVPLTFNDTYATYHWLNKQLLTKKYKLIINASRGGVVNEEDLLEAHESSNVEEFILDVWEDEPDFHKKSVKRALIATPHIAGYSYQAKENATSMICNSLIDFFQLKEQKEDQLEDPDCNCKNYSFAEESADLSGVLTILHPIMEYDSSLREIIQLDEEERRKAFRKLRTDRPYRLEYANLGIPDWLCRNFAVLPKLNIRCNKTFIV